MKKVILTLSLLSVVAFCFAEDEKLITVMDFKTSGVSEQEMVLYVDFISSTVASYPNYIIVERQQREEFLNEITFSNSGCVDESCQLEIGRLLSANEMILGSLGSFGSYYVVNLKLVDVETGKSVHSLSKRYLDMDEVIEEIENVVVELFDLKYKNEENVTDEIEAEDNKQSEIRVSKSTFLGNQYIWNDKIYDQTFYGFDHEALFNDIEKAGDYDEHMVKLSDDFMESFNIGKGFYWGGIIGMVGGTGIVLVGIFDDFNESSLIGGGVVFGIGTVVALVAAFIVPGMLPNDYIEYYNANNPF